MTDTPSRDSEKREAPVASEDNAVERVKVQCEFKGTTDIEAFCAAGALEFEANSHESDFVGVELYLWNQYFGEGARRLIGFPMKVERTFDENGKRNSYRDEKVNSERVLMRLSENFPEMKCRCAVRKPLSYKRVSGTYSSWELSCPHFGIRAIATKPLHSTRSATSTPNVTGADADPLQK